MENKFSNLKEESILCEIYNKVDETERFQVGYIIDFDDETILIESVSPEGRHDGIYCIANEDIITIKYQTIYTKNIEKLMQYNNFHRISFKLNKEKILDGFIKFIKKEKCICTIELCNSFTLTGFIDSINDSILELKLLDSYGNFDGIGVARISDISNISIDTEDLLKLKIICK